MGIGMVGKIKQYWHETLTELSKVTWPSKDELVGSTIVTVIVSLIMGFFTFAVDMGLSQAMRVVLGF
jgi:preprotein translocase subunit SecE